MSRVFLTTAAFIACLACRSIEEREEEEPNKSEGLLADLRIKRFGLAESLPINSAAHEQHCDYDKQSIRRLPCMQEH